MNYLNGGYAMIKHNSTQEELQIAYRSKKPVLCYDENRRAHWAVIEETATESVDEETQEPITIYEYSYRLIDEASGGGKYIHNITMKHSSFPNGKIQMIIKNDNNTPITVSTLETEIVTNLKTFNVWGLIYSNNNNFWCPTVLSKAHTTNIACLYAYGQNNEKVSVTWLTFNSSNITLTDTITEE